MRGRTLIFVAAAWLVAVAIWLLFGRGEFVIAMQGRPSPKALVSAFVFTYWFLLLGWILPLALGIISLSKHR